MMETKEKVKTRDLVIDITPEQPKEKSPTPIMLLAGLGLAVGGLAWLISPGDSAIDTTVTWHQPNSVSNINIDRKSENEIHIDVVTHALGRRMFHATYNNGAVKFPGALTDPDQYTYHSIEKLIAYLNGIGFQKENLSESIANLIWHARNIKIVKPEDLKSVAQLASKPIVEQPQPQKTITVPVVDIEQVRKMFKQIAEAEAKKEEVKQAQIPTKTQPQYPSFQNQTTYILPNWIQAIDIPEDLHKEPGGHIKINWPGGNTARVFQFINDKIYISGRLVKTKAELMEDLQHYNPNIDQTKASDIANIVWAAFNRLIIVMPTTFEKVYPPGPAVPPGPVQYNLPDCLSAVTIENYPHTSAIQGRKYYKIITTFPGTHSQHSQSVRTFYYEKDGNLYVNVGIEQYKALTREELVNDLRKNHWKYDETSAKAVADIMFAAHQPLVFVKQKIETPKAEPKSEPKKELADMPVTFYTPKGDIRDITINAKGNNKYFVHFTHDDKSKCTHEITHHADGSVSIYGWNVKDHAAVKTYLIGCGWTEDQATTLADIYYLAPKPNLKFIYSTADITIKEIKEVLPGRYQLEFNSKLGNAKWQFESVEGKGIEFQSWSAQSPDKLVHILKNLGWGDISEDFVKIMKQILGI